MKKCIHCGAEVPEEEAVCPACGQSVTEEAQTSENQQAQPETEKGPETDEDTCEEKTDPQEDGAQEPAAATPAAAASRLSRQFSLPGKRTRHRLLTRRRPA